MRFYSKFVKQGNLVFDIGACEGDYSEIFLELGGRIIAVEPQAQYLKTLKQKFEGNKNVELVPYGVGDKEGKKVFYISTFNGPNSTFSLDFKTNSRYRYRKWDKKSEIKMVTINKLIELYGSPDFCKIDTEGYELEVLSALKQTIPTISFEFMSELNNKTLGCIEYLEKLGKGKYNLCLGMNYKFLLDKWVSGKDMKDILIRNGKNQWNGDIYVKFS
jgi:FkbM family methyltransferase